MTVIEGGIVGIRDGRIALVESPDGPVRTDWIAKETVDARNSLVLPGLINTHTHAAMICFRGLADDLPLIDGWRTTSFLWNDGSSPRDMVYTGTLLAIAEMTSPVQPPSAMVTSTPGSGSGRCCCRNWAVPSLGFFDLDNPHGDREKIAAMSDCGALPGKMAGRSPLVTPALFPHSPTPAIPRRYGPSRNWPGGLCPFYHPPGRDGGRDLHGSEKMGHHPHPFAPRSGNPG
jgi:5-methylthioadenosine/S-adenosylhomocysteine deaminase